jgi:hypothetical protein
MGGFISHFHFLRILNRCAKFRPSKVHDLRKDDLNGRVYWYLRCPRNSAGIVALTLSLLMWLIAFLAVGGEWFLMWQSKNWSGQEAAFRMFTVIGIVLVLLIQPDTEDQP